MKVNKVLADGFLVPRTPRRGWRYKCSLVYRSGVAGHAAFFRALRVGGAVGIFTRNTTQHVFALNLRLDREGKHVLLIGCERV